MTQHRVSIVTAAFRRPGAVQRLVRSIRRRWPTIPIHIGEQSLPDPCMDHFYAQHGVHVVRVPPDSGVAAARNAAVATVETEAILLCDDDMIITDETSWDDALRLLDAFPDIGVVGGRCQDISFQPGQRTIRNLFWDLMFLHDEKTGHLVTMPSHLLETPPIEIDGIRAHPCDSVINFALFRRSALGGVIRWDERYVCNGEHEDFYLTWKHHSEFRVVFLPTLVCDHHRPPQAGYARLRERMEGWAAFMHKWGLSRHLEFGYGLRTIDDVAGIKEMPDLKIPAPLLAAMHEARLVRYLGDRAFFGDGFPTPWAPDPVVVDAPADTHAFLVHPREHVHGDDFIVQVMLDGRYVTHGAPAGTRLLCSWRLDGAPLVVNAPIELYGHPPVWGEWNAYGITVPEIDGVLQLDLAIETVAGPKVAATTLVICGSRRSLGTEHLPTLAWTRTNDHAVKSILPGPSAVESIAVPHHARLDEIHVEPDSIGFSTPSGGFLTPRHGPGWTLVRRF